MTVRDKTSETAYTLAQRGRGGKGDGRRVSATTLAEGLRPVGPMHSPSEGPTEEHAGLDESTAEEAHDEPRPKSTPPPSNEVDKEKLRIDKIVAAVVERIPKEFADLSEEAREALAKKLQTAATTAKDNYTKTPLQEFSFLLPPNSKLSELVFKEFRWVEKAGKGADAQAEA